MSIWKVPLADKKTTYLRTGGYQKARNARLIMDNFTCQCCGAKSNIEVHHITRKNNDAPDAETDLITLCGTCHERIENTIKQKQFMQGEYFFTIINSAIEHYSGSEKMEPCERLKLELLVHDNKSPFARYITDYIPFLESFIWKWQDFLLSIQYQNEVDTETFAREIAGKTGKLMLAVKNGEYGAFNTVDRYLISLYDEATMY